MTFHNSLTDISDPEVVPKAKRRQFSAQYKVRILEEADVCTKADQEDRSIVAWHFDAATRRFSYW